MARSTATVSLTLRPATVAAVDAAAQAERRSRSQFIDLMLERALAITGADRLRDLEAIAATELEAANAPRQRSVNATSVISENSADGHRRLSALETIAKGTR